MEKKKVLRILALVLAFTLVICASIMIFAGAADDTAGIKVIDTAAHESGTVGTVYLGTGNYPATAGTAAWVGGTDADGGSLLLKKHLGTMTLNAGKNNDGTDNKYLFYTPVGIYESYTGYDSYVTKQGLTDTISATNLTNYFTATENKLTNNYDKYSFVFDADFAPPADSDSFPYGSGFQILSYYADKDGAVTSLFAQVSLDQKTTGSREAVIKSGDKTYDIDTARWNHITMATYIVRGESSYDVYLNVWVNGEFAFKSLVKSGITYYTVDGKAHAAIAAREVRTRLIGIKNEDEAAGIAVDNFAYRSIDLSVNPVFSAMLTNGTDLNGWGGNLYNEDTMPSTMPIAKGCGFQYSVSSNTRKFTDDFATALSSAAAGSTIKMLGDTDYSFPVGADGKGSNVSVGSKTFTFDLGGNALTFYQAYQSAIVMSGTAKLTFKNGDLRARQVYAGHENEAFTLFYTSNGSPSLTLDNVNTYTAQLASALNWGASKFDFTVTVNGGYHSLTHAPYQITGGFVESRVAMDFTANDATFLIDSSNWLVVQYYRTASATPAESVFTFNRCKIIQDPTDARTDGLIRYSDENAKFNFNGCDIYGYINPTVSPSAVKYDESAKAYTTTPYAATPDRNIFFGAGTRFVSSITVGGNSYSNTRYSIQNGNEITRAKMSESYTVLDLTDTPSTGFTFTERVITVEYDSFVDEMLDGAVKYTVGTGEYYTNDIFTALNKASAGSVIYLKTDYTIYGDPSVEQMFVFNNNLTIDLGGHYLSIYQEWQNFFSVNARVTFRNGEIRTVRSSDVKKDSSNPSYNNKSFPLFRFAASGTTVLTLENVNTYTGALIFNYSSSSAVVSIIGGEHHITHHETSGAQGSWGGFIESRGSTVFTATNATFFADRSGWIISSTSYRDNNPSGAGNHAPKGATFTFNGCKLISDPNDTDGKFNLVMYANEHTKININDSLIYGSINPTVYAEDYIDGSEVKSEMWGVMPKENLVLGEGTKVATSINGTPVTLMDMSFDKADFGLVNEEYREMVGIKACNDKPYTDGYIFTDVTLKLSFDKLVADAVHATIILHYPSGAVENLYYDNGATVTSLPTYAIPESVDNGWVKIVYDGGWSLTGFGEVITSLTVSGRIHLYPSAESAKASVTSALYNLSLYGSVGINLLLQDEMSMPEGISLWGVYDNDGKLVTDKRQSIIDGASAYSSYEIGKVGILDLKGSVSAQISFSYNGVDFVQNVTLTPYKYVRRVIVDSETSPKAVTLLSDMIRYATDIHRFASKSNTVIPAMFLESIRLADGSVTTLDAISRENSSERAAASSFEGVIGLPQNEYISAIAFDVSGADPSYVVYFKENTRVVDIKFIIEDSYLTNKPGYNKGKTVYGMNEKTSRYFGATDYLSAAYSIGIPVYNLDCAVEISITVENEHGAKHEVRLEGAYSLNDYYNGICASGSVTEADIRRVKDVLTALRSFANSTVAYRYAVENAGVTQSNIVSIYYEDYGAAGDGVTDDFGAIYRAHQEANRLKYAGRDVTVYAIKPGGRIPEGSTFFIDNTNTSGAYYGKSAEIKTDVVWTGASFIINDYAIFEGTDSNNPSYTKVTTVTNKAFYTPIFVVSPDEAVTNDYYYSYVTLASSRQILSTDTEIPEIKDLALPFEKAMIYVQNSKHYNYIRYGANAGASIQREVVLVDTKTGKIDPSTPIAHDFTSITYIQVFNASEENITLEGGSFETLYNRVNSYSYCKRGIDVRRCNVTLKDISQEYTYSSYNDQVSGGAPMHQFFGTSKTHGLTIDGCIIEGPRHFYDTDNGNGTGTVFRGSYSIRGDFTSSWTIKNVKQTNFYLDGDTSAANNMVDHHASMGSNYCKNVWFMNNKMSTFDSHTGVHNLVVKGCELERINVIGTGSVIVEDTLIHTGVSHSAIVLREDYNSNFKGDVYFKNVTLETYNEGYVGLFWLGFYNYNTGLYYTDGYSGSNGVDEYYAQDKTKGGDDSKYYSAYLPRNVYIDGLTILKGGRVEANTNEFFGGTYTRGTVVTDSSVKLALYNGYDLSGNYTYDTSKAVLDVHEWDCDISTYNSSFKKSSGIFGLTKTTYTVYHPIKPTEYVYNNSGYTLNEYVFKGTVYNSLKFLDNIVIENV